MIKRKARTQASLGRLNSLWALGCRLRLWQSVSVLCILGGLPSLAMQGNSSNAQVQQPHEPQQSAETFPYGGRELLSGELGRCAGAEPSHNSEQAQLYLELGHSKSVSSVAFSMDGRQALTGSWDGTARLWDLASGKEVRCLEGHRDKVTSVAFSPDGRWALTGSDDYTARIWDLASGNEIKRLWHFRSVKFVAFLPDGARALTGGYGAAVWDVRTCKVVQRVGRDSEMFTSVALSPDGRRALTGSLNGTVFLWDLNSGKEIQRLKADSYWVTSVAFSPDGSRALAASLHSKRSVNTDLNGTARVWNLETGEEMRHVKGKVQSVAFSPDGRWALTGSYDGTAKVWEVETGKEIRRLEGHSRALQGVAFSPDGRWALTGSQDGSARVWDLETGKEIRRLEGHSEKITFVAFSPDGRWALAGSQDGSARIWDLERGGEVRYLETGLDSLTSAAFSPDGRQVLTCCGDHAARLWDVETGKEIRRLESDSEKITCVAFSPNGRQALTGSYDGTVRLWEVATGKETPLEEHTKEIRRLKVYEKTVTSVAFSPDGHRALISEEKNVRLWDLETDKEIRRLGAGFGTFNSATFSPDGRHALIAGWGDARVWDLATGTERSLDSGFEPHTSVALSPDGRRALTGSLEGTAQLWNLETNKEIWRLEVHFKGVESVAFSPDGHSALTGSDDGTTRVWDAASGRLLATLVSFREGGWAVVDPEGRFDASTLDGGIPLHWFVDDESMRPLPLEIFMRDYYTPRLLSRIMNGEPLPLVRSIAEIKNRVQPDVRIVSVSASKSHSSHVDVVVHAASHVSEKGQASGLQDLRLFRNGQMVGYREGTLRDGDLTFSDIQLPNSTKSVTFTAYAFNSERIKSATATKDYAYTPGPWTKPRAWLLQIGVNHYQANNCELHGSANDAEQLSKILSERLTKR